MPSLFLPRKDEKRECTCKQNDENIPGSKHERSESIEEKAVAEAYEDGVRVFSFLYPMMTAWKEDGTFDFTLPDTLTDRIMKLVPDGQMMPRAFLTTPFWWDEKYP